MGSWGEEGEKSASEMSVKGERERERRSSKPKPLQYFELGIVANCCRSRGFVGSLGAVVKAMCLRAHLVLQDHTGPKGLA